MCVCVWGGGSKLYRCVFVMRNKKAQRGSKLFPFRKDPFSEGDCCAGCKQEITKVVFLVINGGKSTKCVYSP